VAWEVNRNVYSLIGSMLLSAEPLHQPDLSCIFFFFFSCQLPLFYKLRVQYELLLTGVVFFIIWVMLQSYSCLLKLNRSTVWPFKEK